MLLHRFHGGLKLSGHKTESTALPLQPLPVPPQLCIPLLQHIGEPTRPLVRPGDTVRYGQRIGQAEDYISAHIHSPASGKVIDIGEYPVPHPSGLAALCIVLQTDSCGENLEPALEPWKNWKTRDPRALRERVREAGIVGLGGAAFPTAVKINPRPGKPIHTLVVNGAECEPYISCDDMLMRTYTKEILEGARIVAHIVGASRIIVAVEDNKPEALRRLNLSRNPEEESFLTIVSIPTVYPTGGEKQLIRVLTGKEVPSAGLPADLGIVCHNPGTLRAIHDAVIYGRPLTHRIVTVTGSGIRHPRNLEVPIGASFADLVRATGGYHPDVNRLIMGGPMMGFAVNDDVVPVIKGTNCLLATRPEDTPSPGPLMPCIRCGECAAVCPAQLLPQQLYWHAKALQFDDVQEYGLFDCIECGCCAHVCPSNIPLVQYYRHAKQEIWSRERERQKADLARERFEFRQERQDREEQEKAARLARKKAVLANKADSEDAKKNAIEAALERARAKRAENSGSEKAASPSVHSADNPSTTGQPQAPTTEEKTYSADRTH